jgi:hypothetical protein
MQQSMILNALVSSAPSTGLAIDEISALVIQFMNTMDWSRGIISLSCLAHMNDLIMLSLS